MLHLAMVRSPFAHAKISCDRHRRGQGQPGVIAIFTGEDLKDIQGVNINGVADHRRAEDTPTTCPSPSTTSRCAGEIVAVVAARTAAEARDAAELVDVDYDELPAVLDLKKAATDEVLAHPDLGTNRVATWQLDSAEAGTGGDVEEAIATARERRHRHRARVPPAAAHPGLHGAALDGRRPDRASR